MALNVLLESSAPNDSTHDHDDTTTPTTKGWRSDVSIILPGRSVTLVGPSHFPRYTSAVKDGKSWVAQASRKAAKHHKNTIYTKTFSTWWRSDVVPGCSGVVAVERAAAEPEMLTPHEMSNRKSRKRSWRPTLTIHSVLSRAWTYPFLRKPKRPLKLFTAFEWSESGRLTSWRQMLQVMAWCPSRRRLPATVQGGAEGTDARVLALHTMRCGVREE